jgi:PadR family transcriptional regulator PadR
VQIVFPNTKLLGIDRSIQDFIQCIKTMKGLLGQFELITILAVMQRSNNAYGSEIQECLREIGGRSVTLGAIHRTLQRLEERGLVESRLADEKSDRIGRPRRYFKVTGAGLHAVNEVRSAVGRLVANLNPALGVR